MDLSEKLTRRPALRHRNAVAFITVRSWRAASRGDDLRAFKQEKRAAVSALLSTAADDVAAEVAALLAPGPGWSVTCIAGGHSRSPDSWGKRLARLVAARLALPFVQRFADRPVAGSSHPKEFRRLPPLVWHQAPDGPVIVIDDVVTSGWHMEEALGMIRSSGHVAVGFAWIGGTVKGGEEAAPSVRERAEPEPVRTGVWLGS